MYLILIDMIKKPIILLFALFFLLSNTGLPLTIHFCKMQNVSKKKCSSCNMHQEDSKQVQISKITGKCCQTSVIKSNIKDNYLSSKVSDDSKCFTSVLICSQQINFQSYLKDIPKKDTSPPLISPGNLYLFNSILLI